MTADERVLVLMPTAKDAQRTLKALADVGMECSIVADLPALCHEIADGAGAVLITEEAVADDTSGRLGQLLRAQPTWSNLPLVVIAREGPTSARIREVLNVTLVERPVKFRSLVSVLRACLRSRRHQYKIRDLLNEQHQQAKALQQSEERLRRMINIDGVGVLVFALPDGLLLDANDYFLRTFGYRRSDIEARALTWRDMTPPEYIAASEAQVEHLALTGRIGPYEKEYFRRDGSRSWMLFAGAALDDHTVVEYCIDVTDRKRTEEALRVAHRRKDEFIATLAHELRNPLAPLRDGLQILRLAAGNEEVVAEARTMMDRQLTHMVRLIDDLLDVSRISRNKLKLQKQRILLADLMASAVETARPAIEAAEHKLTISLPPNPVVLYADLTRLAQVVSNLLMNSAKYTDRSGEIHLAAQERGSELVIVVTDNGMGIPAQALPNIFEMFTQVDRASEHSTGGLGIGLALVRGIVHMHGGTVIAESAGAGKGSTFIVTLPVLEAPFESPQNSATEGRPIQRTRVLVADDNEDSVKSMAMMLRLLGHDVRTAHDGVAAVTAAEEFLPQVILMDIGMPRMNGLDATRRIRQSSWGRDITIVALTGWGQEGDKEQSRRAGCTSHLVKPVGLTDLEKAISKAQC